MKWPWSLPRKSSHQPSNVCRIKPRKDRLDRQRMHVPVSSDMYTQAGALQTQRSESLLVASFSLSDQLACAASPATVMAVQLLPLRQAQLPRCAGGFAGGPRAPSRTSLSRECSRLEPFRLHGAPPRTRPSELKLCISMRHLMASDYGSAMTLVFLHVASISSSIGRCVLELLRFGALPLRPRLASSLVQPVH